MVLDLQPQYAVPNVRLNQRTKLPTAAKRQRDLVLFGTQITGERWK
jgi:hypothetical protein